MAGPGAGPDVPRMPVSLGYWVCLCVAVLLGGSAGVRTWIGGARWLPPFLSLMSVVVAVLCGVEGFRISGGSGWRILVCVLAGLMIAGLLGHWLPLQKWVNREVLDASGRLERMRELPAASGIRLVTVLLVLNPIGWVAAWTAGVHGDWHPMAWKAALDAVTLMGLPSGSRGTVFLGALASGVVHLAMESLGIAGRSLLESHNVVGVILVVSGCVWLTVPMLVLRLRRVPLATLALAVPCAAAVGWFW
jgi:uncharacterized membrane protein YqgA involved in biofilm formation